MALEGFIDQTEMPVLLSKSTRPDSRANTALSFVGLGASVGERHFLHEFVFRCPIINAAPAIGLPRLCSLSPLCTTLLFFSSSSPLPLPAPFDSHVDAAAAPMATFQDFNFAHK